MKVIEAAGKALEVAASQPMTDRPVDLVQRYHASLADIDALKVMAKREDGAIKNARLMVVAVDLEGKTIERMGRTLTMVDKHSELTARVDALYDVIEHEEPEVRRRIFAKLDAVNARFRV